MSALGGGSTECSVEAAYAVADLKMVTILKNMLQGPDF